MKKILIGLPTTGYQHFLTTSSIMNLQTPKDFEMGFRFISSCLIYDARESLCKYALENKFDYILMVDSDMTLPPDTIIKYVETLETCDIVSGLIFKRIYPFQPCIYLKARISEHKDEYNRIEYKPHLEGLLKWTDNSIVPIEACGMAACMMKTEILPKIKKPWFYPFPNMGEDITFCIKARQEINAKMMCDTRVDIGHLSVMPITSQYQKEALLNWEKNNDNQGKLLYVNEDEEEIKK
jgi:hypothetical protein